MVSILVTDWKLAEHGSGWTYIEFAENSQIILIISLII